MNGWIENETRESLADDDDDKNKAIEAADAYIWKLNVAKNKWMCEKERNGRKKPPKLQIPEWMGDPKINKKKKTIVVLGSFGDI